MSNGYYPDEEMTEMMADEWQAIMLIHDLKRAGKRNEVKKILSSFENLTPRLLLERISLNRPTLEELLQQQMDITEAELNAILRPS